MDVYRERAELIAFLSRIFDSWLLPNPEPEDNFSYIVYVDSPRGQLSWHLADTDLDLFTHVKERKLGEEGYAWDGHTTDEKYDRLRGIGVKDVRRYLSDVS